MASQETEEEVQKSSLVDERLHISSVFESHDFNVNIRCAYRTRTDIEAILGIGETTSSVDRIRGAGAFPLRFHFITSHVVQRRLLSHEYKQNYKNPESRISSRKPNYINTISKSAIKC